MWLRGYLRYCAKYLRMVTVYTKCTRVSEYVSLRFRITSTGNRIVTDSENQICVIPWKNALRDSAAKKTSFQFYISNSGLGRRAETEFKKVYYRSCLGNQNVSCEFKVNVVHASKDVCSNNVGFGHLLNFLCFPAWSFDSCPFYMSSILLE